MLESREGRNTFWYLEGRKTPKYVRPKKEKKNEKGLSFCKFTNILSCAILKQKLKKKTG